MLSLIIIPLIKENHSYSGVVTPVCRTTRVLYMVALQGHREVAHKKTGNDAPGNCCGGVGDVGFLFSYSNVFCLLPCIIITFRSKN